ncbi:carboxylesterase [Hysterangium stoloniferum]|nr:carboxylesterase [Hysterangium stoloniferum]
MKFLSGLLLLAALLVPYTGAQTTDGTTVQTLQGAVTGSIVTTGVRQFLGIPYATAKRWQAPQTPAKRSSTLKATSFGPACPQSLTPNNNEFLILSGAGGQAVQESEACQSVNIWTPTVDRKQGAAVMIWIYGGSFAFGTGDSKYYIGENSVRDNDDIVVVSFNYRTNIFGQPNAPQLASTTKSQNFGLLDQRAAIQWVHDNIAVFGGDPDRIILFGESAGSISADAYSYANPTDTIVKGIIQESGSLAGNSLLAPQGPVTTVVSWEEVATSVGCTDITSPFQLACMELIPFEELINVVIALDASFAPVPDEITYFSDTNARSAAGNFLKVPLLIGSNAQEGDVFVVALEQLSLGGDIPGLTQEGSTAVTELMFNCPASITAAARVNAGVSTWRYMYEAVFPDLTNNRPDLHAYHASEIPIVFGTYNSSAFSPAATAAEISLSKYVQSAWVAFARDPTNGLVNFGWPKYNPSTASVARLGSTGNQTGVVFAPTTMFDSGCSSTEAELSLVEQVLALTGF